ncbi:hypothetical protein K2X33_12990 [bacterium]|nr:hypothetical protein [bacterium]
MKFLTGVLVLGAAVSASASFKQLRCSGGDGLNISASGVELVFQGSSAPDEIYDLFNVPGRERKGMEQVRLVAKVPVADCKLPTGFSINVNCEGSKKSQVTLQSALSWEPVGGTFDDEKTIQADVEIETKLSERKGNNVVTFKLKADGKVWESKREIFEIEFGKSNRCYVDGTYEIR